MKKITVFFFVMLVAAALSAPAFAASYLSGSYSFVKTADADIYDGIDSGEISFDDGFGLLVAYGIESDGGGRIEVELGYRSSDFDEWKIDGVGTFDVPGEIESISLMGNAYVDFVPQGRFSPYLGVGIGLARLEEKVTGLGDAHDLVGAYQLSLGGRYRASDIVTLDLQYRFFGTSEPTFEDVEAEYSNHNFMLSLRRYF